VPDELIEVVKKEYPSGGRDDFGGGYGKFGGGYRKFGSKTFGGGAPIGAQQSDSFGFGKSKWNDDEDDVVYI
jgi:hypothetical protein